MIQVISKKSYYDEIATLEATLSTAREVKAGMMSVLLSGKIRLNHD